MPRRSPLPLLITSAALFGSGFAVSTAVRSGPPTAAAAPAPPTDREQARAERRTPVVDVFESARDAVVSISSTEIVTVRSASPFGNLFDDFFDMPSHPRTWTQKRQSVGSGFVIHPDGYIVTNAHVVAGTTEQRVSFADGREYEAQIVAADTVRDLAVLKVNADAPLPTLRLGRSDDLMIGETVIAIGNPLGYQHTCTAGIVSAVDREIEVSPQLSFKGLIQTDASINPGNSGGPLLNALGELIGVNSAIRGDAQNIGFAIPVDQLREVLPDLLDVERRYRITTGLTVDTLDEPKVSKVEKGSPADEAGIDAGDVLLAIDGRPVHEGVDFDIALINRKAGDTLDLSLERNGKTLHSRLTLGSRPAPDGEELAREKLGVDVYPLPEAAADRLGLRRSGALVVTQTEPNGPADQAGVEPRDVLLAVGRHYVADTDDLGQILDGLSPGTQVTVRVLRVERGRKVQMEGPITVR